MVRRARALDRRRRHQAGRRADRDAPGEARRAGGPSRLDRARFRQGRRAGVPAALRPSAAFAAALGAPRPPAVGRRARPGAAHAGQGRCRPPGAGRGALEAVTRSQGRAGRGERRSGRAAQGSGPDLRARAPAAPPGPLQRGGRPARPAAAGRAAARPDVGGAQEGAAAARSTRAISRPPTGWRRRMARTTARPSPRASSWRAGSRCASSTTRRPR